MFCGSKLIYNGVLNFLSARMDQIKIVIMTTQQVNRYKQFCSNEYVLLSLKPQSSNGYQGYLNTVHLYTSANNVQRKMLDFYPLHYNNCLLEVIVKAKKDKFNEIKTKAKIKSKKKVKHKSSGLTVLNSYFVYCKASKLKLEDIACIVDRQDQRHLFGQNCR